MYTTFIPLAPGEVPGDPELGGWRPMPKYFFRKSTPLPFPVSAISLEQAIQLINFEFRYLRLLRAVEKVNIGLLQAQNIFTKGGKNGIKFSSKNVRDCHFYPQICRAVKRNTD